MIRRWRVLSILFMLVGLANLIRAWVAVYIAPALEGVSLALPLPLLGLGYLLCGLCFIAAGLIYWWRKGHRYAVGLAIAYQTLLWILRVAGDRSDYARSLWPRDAVITAAFLTIVIALAHSTKRRE